MDSLQKSRFNSEEAKTVEKVKVTQIMTESYAMACVKKQISVLQRRAETFDAKFPERGGKWSRKAWLKKSMLEIMTKCLVLDYIPEKGDHWFYGLRPSPDEKHLDLDAIKLMPKKFRKHEQCTGVRFSNHALMRLLQVFKTSKLEELKAPMSAVTGIIMDNDIRESGGIYIAHIGFVSLGIYNREVTIKTVIAAHSLGRGSKHLRIYEKMVEDGDFVLIVADEPEKRRN